MTRHEMIFVNLPVADLGRSRAFFTGLGYVFDEDFCDGDALCLQLGPAVWAMLLHKDFFGCFHDRRTADPGTVETLLCLSAGSRAEVDSVVDRAVLAGGSDVRTEDLGFMYGRSYADPDGHVWEIMWMDPRAARGGPVRVPDETVEVAAGPRRAEGER